MEEHIEEMDNNMLGSIMENDPLVVECLDIVQRRIGAATDISENLYKVMKDENEKEYISSVLGLFDFLSWTYRDLKELRRELNI